MSYVSAHFSFLTTFDKDALDDKEFAFKDEKSHLFVLALFRSKF